MTRPLILDDNMFAPSLPPPRYCPVCWGETIAGIAYGLPSKKTKLLARAGKLVLGGCCLNSQSPGWFCKTCQNRWSRDAKIRPEEQRGWEWYWWSRSHSPRVILRDLYRRTRQRLRDWADGLIWVPLLVWRENAHLHTAFVRPTNNVHVYIVKFRARTIRVERLADGRYETGWSLGVTDRSRQALLEKAAVRIAKAAARAEDHRITSR